MGWRELGIVAVVLNVVVVLLDRTEDTVFASVVLSLVTLVALALDGERRG